MLSLLGWLDELSLFVGATIFDIPINEFLSGSEPYDKRYRRDEILTVVVLGIQRKFFKKTAAERLGYFRKFATVRVQWKIPNAAVIRFYFKNHYSGAKACNACEEYLKAYGGLNCGIIYKALGEGNYVK
jgi:hypothetical protein